MGIKTDDDDVDDDDDDDDDDNEDDDHDHDHDDNKLLISISKRCTISSSIVCSLSWSSLLK